MNPLSGRLRLGFACGMSFVLVAPVPGWTAGVASEPAAGKAVYDQHCAACHGAQGDGNGPAAVWLFPKPRDFSAGLYKIQSTPSGALPSDEDLYRTVTEGLGGSSMPSFRYLTEQQRRDVVEYVKYLTADVVNGQRVNRFEQAEANGTLGSPITVPPEPPLTFDSITRGRELYVELQCVTCHGENGAGDGPSAATLKDSFGVPIPPRDFNTGSFRGGSSGKDLYTRIAVGLGGTPMVAYPDRVVSPEDRWALVHYIQSLRRKDVEVSDILAPEEGRITVRKWNGRLPLDPADPAWERVESVHVPLNPLWPEPYPVYGVAVRALHNGRRIAILLQWRDDIFDGAPVRVQDFQDAAAMQFSLTGRTPFIAMGDSENPVNVWQWKAGWQQEVDGRRPDVNVTYASLHVDLYPEPDEHALYRTAEAAGNLLASTGLRSPVEDANATGFGSMTSQPPKSQNVGGKGIWNDGFWSVLFWRDLKSKDDGDVKLVPGSPLPVAFAIWNGAQRDRNGRKEISNWHQLILAE